MEFEILIEAPEWDAVDLPALAQRAGDAALAELGLEPAGFSLSLLACDDARIATLNTQFRGKPVPTNVLSWPAEERAADAPGQAPSLDDLPEELGDIALAFQTCATEATDGNKSLADHVTHLIVHGLLHCLGYDHEDDADAELMEALETRILARLGGADPY